MSKNGLDAKNGNGYPAVAMAALNGHTAAVCCVAISHDGRLGIIARDHLLFDRHGTVRVRCARPIRRR